MGLSTQIALTIIDRIMDIADDENTSAINRTRISDYTTQLAGIIKGLDEFSIALIDDLKTHRVENKQLHEENKQLRNEIVCLKYEVDIINGALEKSCNINGEPQ